MTGYPFFAMLARMKHIGRWGLMRNTRAENIQEHSLQVAFFAHALALVRNRYFGGNVDQDRAAVAGMFHDCDEILTGDLPTPVKYFNDGIRDAYRAVESAARQRLVAMLPERLHDDYEGLINPAANDGETNNADDAAVWRIVKAADTLSAYVKCLEELAGGNTEFAAAKDATYAKLKAMDMPEVDLFIEEFIGAFSLSLDEYGI